jgi:hypothetical protein
VTVSTTLGSGLRSSGFGAHDPVHANAAELDNKSAAITTNLFNSFIRSSPEKERRLPPDAKRLFPALRHVNGIGHKGTGNAKRSECKPAPTLGQT